MCPIVAGGSPRDWRVVTSWWCAACSLAIAGSGASGPGLVSYLVTADTLVTWVASPGHVPRVIVAPVRRDSIYALVRTVRSGLSQIEDLERCAIEGDAVAGPHGSSTDAALRALSAILLSDTVRRLLPPSGEVVIIPQGALQALPFAVLPFDTTLFGIRYAIRYAPSLDVLALSQARDSVRRDDPRAWDGSVVVADPVMPTVSICDLAVFRLQGLPVAGASARRLALRLRVRALAESAATVSAVQQAWSAAPLVHLATHGYAYQSEGRARDSWVALAPGRDTSGFLTVAGILSGPPLRAELVTLAACATALGESREMEGTVGFQRALLARGARSVLVSLWVVREDAAAILLDHFYHQWLDNPARPSKAEALRRAEIETRRVYPDPRDWAAFQLVGAP